MTGFSDPILTGDGSLIRIVERSDNYVAGVSGWAIFADGSCEFNSGTFRGTVSAGTFTGTDFVINPSGAFFYSAAPAAGNLIVSIAPAAGTDAYGNTYPKGIQVSGGGLNKMILDPGFPEFSLNPDTSKYVSGWGRLYAADQGAHGALILESPINISGAAGEARLTVAGQDSGGGRGAYFTFETTGTPAGLAQFSVPAVLTGESWQTPTYNTNWATSTTFNGLSGLGPLRFRRDAEDNVWIQGCFKAGGTLPAAAVFALPAGYMPAVTQMIPCMRNNAGAPTAGMALINNAGNVDLFAGANMGVAINNEYYINGKVALGNIA